MKILKILLVVFISLFYTGTAMAQSDKKEQRKIERAEKKRLKEEVRKKNLEQLQALVEDQTYVLESTSIFGRNMNRYEVSPNTNFVKIEGDQLTVQTASIFHFGYNGLGGITINGNIQEYKIYRAKKNNSISVLIQFTSPVLGHSSLSFDIQPNGTARAMLRDNWGGRVTFQGQMVDLESSRVFKGMSII
jgi:hypothetical protein